MNSVRSLYSLIVCLCVPRSSASASSSLWGKKISVVDNRCVWQLQPGTVVPALQELSVCVLLRINAATLWTGFVYKAPGTRQIELGLQGTDDYLDVWLFATRHHLKSQLNLKQWHSLCLTWSGQAQRLQVYINGSVQYNATVDRQQLAHSGTLTLGVSHFADSGIVTAESGNNLYGDIGRFGMWRREWSAEELSGPSCADGDVLSWDMKQWKHNCRPPEPDSYLYCAWSLYKLTMWTVIRPTTTPENCSASLEEVARSWLESVFTGNISVHHIIVSSPSSACHGVNNSAAPHVQQPQTSQALSNGSCDKCFWSDVYVKVDPAASVEEVQAEIAALLNPSFSYNFLNLTSDPDSISVLPVESFPAVTEPTPTVSTGVPTSQAGPTQSLPATSLNISTTGEPLDLNKTAYGPGTFFRVNMNLIMSGSPTKPKDIIKNWVKQQLEVNNTMTVLNVVIEGKHIWYREQYDAHMIFPDQKIQYYCKFHIQEYKTSNVTEIKTLINAALASNHENDSIVIQPMDLVIRHIEPENCVEEYTPTIYGDYTWPETFPQEVQQMGCVKPTSERAYRLCKLDIKTDTASWAYPKMTNCLPTKTITGLRNITITIGNAAQVVHMIQDLVEAQLVSHEELSASDLSTVVYKLGEVVKISIITFDIVADIVDIIADILQSETHMTPVANSILKMTEEMGNNMDFNDDSVNVTAPSLAVSMINVNPDEFKGLTFGVSSISSNLNPQIFLDENFVSDPSPDTIATISLPSTLQDHLHPGQNNTARILFSFYGTQDLFQDPLTTNATHRRWTLNSYIVSASINNSHVSDLKNPVVVTLQHQIPTDPDDKVYCMFWDFQKHDGQGGWNSRGCVTSSISSNLTSCLCDHLTHFAVLLDISRTPISPADSQILTVISYLGCGISSIFLGMTLLTYLVFEKLRRDYPSKILINLSASLLGLCMLFLINSWLSSFSSYGLCIATAATLHYFLLASFTWMGLEAVNMYFAFVKVFNIYVPSYILKFCAVGWGVPLVIVSLVLAIDKDVYGTISPEEAAVALESTEPFCWLQNDVYFYVTVVAFVLLILLCNVSVFIVVLIQIRHMRVNKRSANSRSSLHDLRTVASLTVLLGLTWAMAFFSFGPARVTLLYLFSIFNSFQGFFVFLFHCLMKENVRKHWRLHLCCGRFRPKDCSDWSRTMTAGGAGKKNILVNSDSVASNSTSTVRKVSDSSTGSAPKHHQGA